MNGESLDIKNDQLEKLKELFPEVITEDKVDWEKLKASLGEDVNFNNERYVLNWAGKSEAFKILQLPITDTLVPCPEESINFDTTQNVFIEGENLRVLKALQKSYYGKVKCIIIDPPYNTGNDSFIYPDKFSEKKEDYQKRVGDKDEEGYMMKEGLFHKNSKDSGHYHSNWLNMMYPRLFLAKNLMRDDGVVFVHIDDNEVHNLRLIMNEIFGEENFIGKIIWKNVTDNNPTLINLDHEYIYCFAKNKSSLPQAWKSFQSDAKELLKNKYEELKKLKLSNEEIEKGIRDFISDNTEIMGFLTRYKNVDDNGVYIGSESVHNPKAGGYVYDILHPITRGKMKIPANGYRFPYDSFKELDNQGKIIYGEDEDRIIKIKKYLDEFEDTLRSVINMDGRLGSYDLKRIFNEKVFNNPKPIDLLMYILSFVIEKDDIVLDFFGGSGSTAESVLRLNARDAGERKFILVQLPELCDEKSEAYKANFRTISEITKERISRVIQKLEKERSKPKQLGLDIGNDSVDQSIKEKKQKVIDLGFKFFRLANSNFKIWRSDEINEENLSSQLDAFTNPVKEGSEKENMLYELILKSGYELTNTVEYNKKSNYYSINKNELVIGLEKMNKEIVDAIISSKPKKVITLDNLFTGNDQLKTNTVLQMKDAGIDFKTI
jgi:adenine-specific DNA-methyltransferase